MKVLVIGGDGRKHALAWKVRNLTLFKKTLFLNFNVKRLLSVVLTKEF